MSLDSDWSSFASGGGGFRVSQKWSLGLGALELAKDIGLFLFYVASSRSRFIDFSSRLTGEA